jgi:hypothetical protein
MAVVSEEQLSSVISPYISRNQHQYQYIDMEKKKQRGDNMLKENMK